MGVTDEMDEVVKEFLVESYENLDALDRALVILEEDPSNREGLASIFRTIHTIKGTCGFLGLGKLESVAHVGENLLSLMRDGKLLLNTEITSALLAMVDAIRTMLACLETTGTDGDDAYGDLIALLTSLQDPEPAATASPATIEAAPTDERTASVTAPTPAPASPATSRETAVTPPPSASTTATPPPPPARPAPSSPPGTAPAATDQADTRASAVSDTNIRVDVALLDRLMNLAGELVLARNQILQCGGGQRDAAFVAASQRLNLITTELQEGVMKTRMQPIKNVWSKFPRVVRDLSVTCGKHVRIEMEGEDTELDKTIIEAIKDPLTHVVRNSVDHGIETPEERKAAGKPPEGRLLLRAFHESGQVNIEIRDDGKGIDPERLKEKAIQRGLVTPEHASRMSEREALNLIFRPGFSTAEKITNVSGRGVGMDVVKTNIERIGGTVDVQSRPGQETTLRVKIPLTLAIIPALIVTSGGDRYSIPQVSLIELVRLDGTQARTGIEVIHGAPVYRLRGELLPLLYLHQELHGKDAAPPTDPDAPVNIVVLQADERQFGLVVESVNDTEEIVVKPLGKQLKGIPAFAGATIMGDGTVGLILDVMGIAQRGHILAPVREDRGHARQNVLNDDASSQRQALLLLGVGTDRRLAVPLSMVARLEEFAPDAVEHAGAHEVVEYRGSIMPLVRSSHVLGAYSEVPSSDAPLQVVVYSDGDRSVGLVVDAILDIVTETVLVTPDASGQGIAGTLVIHDRVTELLDLPTIIRGIDPSLFARAAA